MYIDVNAIAQTSGTGAETEQLRRILDLLPQMVWANEGDLQYYSAKWLEFTGRELSAAESRFNLVHPDDRADALLAWDEAQRTGEYEVEYRLRHRTGDYRWVVSRGNPRRDSSGAIVGWYGTCTDIHDRRHALDALRRSEAAKDHAVRRYQDVAAKQRAIFDGVDDGIVVHDRQGVIQRANPAAGFLFAYEPSQMCGLHINSLFEKPPTSEELDQYLEYVAREAARRNAREFSARRSDGSVFPADVLTSPVNLNDGTAFIAVVRNVEERKRLDRLKDEFVSIVSHELRTPLTAIAGSLGLVAGGAAGGLPTKAEKLIKIAQSNSARLVRLVNDILDVEKMQSGKMQFDVQEIDLSVLLEQVLEANKHYARPFDVSLELVDDEESRIVVGDPDRLAQVFTNLLSNAIKFSPAGGVVRLTTQSAGIYHRVSVADAGPGIPEEFRSRIFGKFAQADSSDAKIKGGTGLGLSIVKEIVALTGGAITFQSAAGEGTVFHVDLPTANCRPK